MGIQFFLWLAFFFFIGCIIGYFLRWLLSDEQAAGAAGAGAATGAAVAQAPVAKPEPVEPPKAGPDPEPLPEPQPEPMAVASPVDVEEPKETPRQVKPRATGKPQRPTGIAKARSGKADNLQQISGVGPKLEKTLQGLGFYHFDQIAGWTSDEVMWVDEHLRFKGRIDRDDWIAQAKLLAAGETEKFAELYGTGGLKTAKGKAKPGKKTRKKK